MGSATDGKLTAVDKVSLPTGDDAICFIVGETVPGIPVAPP